MSSKPNFSATTAHDDPCVALQRYTLVYITFIQSYLLSEYISG